MDNIAIYGGGFDPISLHHRRVMSTVHAATGFPIWAMPCYSHKYGKKMEHPKHRLNMVRIVCKKHDHDDFVACAFEIENQLNGNYYYTLGRLKKEYPDKKFHTIIGTDNANDIAEDKWVESANLIAENSFIVLERGQHPPKTDWFLRDGHKYFKLGDVGSSTSIRKAIMTGNTKFAMDNLDPDVWDYIQREGLYQ